MAYVERQKKHHAHNTIIPILERTDDTTVKLIREIPPIYQLAEEAWRRELEVLSDLVT